MNREADEKREKGEVKKAKLDSQGRPIAVEAPKLDKRADGPTPVRVAVRLGVLLCALSTQSGCEPEAEPLDPRVERAIAEAGEAAKDARAAADIALASADAVATLRASLGRLAEEAGRVP